MGDNAIPDPDAVVDPDGSARKNAVIPEVMGRGESVEQFRELMEHLQQVFWIKNAKTKGVLYVSPAYEKIWGRTCQSLYDDFQSLEDSIHPEDRERIAGAMDGDRDVSSREVEFAFSGPMGKYVGYEAGPIRFEMRRAKSCGTQASTRTSLT